MVSQSDDYVLNRHLRLRISFETSSEALNMILKEEPSPSQGADWELVL